MSSTVEPAERTMIGARAALAKRTVASEAGPEKKTMPGTRTAHALVLVLMLLAQHEWKQEAAAPPPERAAASSCVAEHQQCGGSKSSNESRGNSIIVDLLVF